jgi:hypothetical protein
MSKLKIRIAIMNGEPVAFMGYSEAIGTYWIDRKSNMHYRDYKGIYHLIPKKKHERN